MIKCHFENGLTESVLHICYHFYITIVIMIIIANIYFILLTLFFVSLIYMLCKQNVVLHRVDEETSVDIAIAQ